MNGRRREIRRGRGGTYASAALLVAIGIACGPERPTRPPPQGGSRGGPLVLETRGRGYVELYDSDFGYFGGCKYMCDLTIHAGRTITLTPRTDSCFEFVGWTGVCAGQFVCVLSSGGQATAVFTNEPSGGEWRAPPAPLPDSPPPPFEVAGYAITEITHSPYGLFIARALDEDGDVLGGIMNCGTRPGRYDAATGTHSVLTPLPDADAVAIAAASDGTVLVSDGSRSYRWKDGVLESIGSLGGERTYAAAMNAAGWVVGWGDLASGNGTPHAFLHDGTEMKDLGEGWAHAVNAEGDIVGIKGQEAALFGPPTILFPIPSRAVAYDVSDTGVVVGSAGQGLDQKWPPAAFVYDLRTGFVTEVDPLPGDTTVMLVHVNRSGTLAVGGSGNREQARSVVWADGHLYDFSTYVGVQGAPTTFAVFDVNDRGQFLIETPESIRFYVLTPR